MVKHLSNLYHQSIFSRQLCLYAQNKLEAKKSACDKTNVYSTVYTTLDKTCASIR